MIMIVAILTSR